MKKLITCIVAFAICFSFTANGQKVNKLTKAEKKNGWVLLFDGKDSKGWRKYGQATFPDKGWEVTDGTLHCIAKGGGGDIMYDKKFKDFELSMDWKIGKNGNSGIFYRVQEIEGKPIYYSAPEIQILDNEGHPDAKAGVDGNHKAGSLYDMLPAVPQNTKPYGEWNTIVIKVQNNHVTHIQNGEKVCEYTIGTPEWREMCAKSKFKDWAPFVNIASEGYIGLQDHGDDVWFRNIKIKELP